jgi:hypothetical protein
VAADIASLHDRILSDTEVIRDGNMRLWSRIRSWVSRPSRPDPEIRVTEDGFNLLSTADGKTIATVKWVEVSRIQTWKIDLLTTDCICLLFQFHSGRAPVQVSEEWSGFGELFEPLATSFPSIPSSWYVDVMSPAFETKQTVLFESLHGNRTVS